MIAPSASTLTDSAFARLVAEVRPEDALEVSPDAGERLRIRAVPALFVVDSRQRVRDVRVAAEGTTHAQLRDACG